MATETVTHAHDLGQRALRLLREIQQESERAFAIAAAGRALAGERSINECRLFESIEDILGDAELQNSLQGTITELAALAGASRG